MDPQAISRIASLKVLDNKLAKAESQLQQLAKQIADTRDCVNESHWLIDTLVSEAQIFERKTQCMSKQIAQETEDQLIILKELERLTVLK